MNLTDNEWIKIYNAKDGTWDKDILIDEANNIINRQKAVNELAAKKIVDLKLKVKEQKAEIEKYDNIKTTIHKFWDILLKLSLAKRKEKPTLEELAEAIAEIEAEAIKEFAERLKMKAWFDGDYDGYLIDKIDIDNLVKERVGE